MAGRLEWRRDEEGKWHRVRCANDMALCRRIVRANAVPDEEPRELQNSPPAADRCWHCEMWWPLYTWAIHWLESLGETVP